VPCGLFDSFRSERGDGTYSTEDKLREAISAVTGAMELDKKIRAKAIRWVLLEDIGRVTIRSKVSRQNVLDILRELL
jgi:3-dehydroquinate synthetase